MHLLCDGSLDLSTVGNWGVGGAAIALVAYLIKVTIPKIVDTFRIESAQARKEHARLQESAQAAFKAELAEERKLSQQREQAWRHTLLGLMTGKTLAAYELGKQDAAQSPDSIATPTEK